MEANTVNAWETGRAEPKTSYLGRIIEFLGYEPFQGAMTFAERLREKRRNLGLTQYQLARQLDVPKDTISLLETGKEVTNRRVLTVVREFVEAEA